MPNQASTCSVETCARPRWARGLCGTHYRRWRKTGDIHADVAVRDQSAPLAERFWAKVDRSGPVMPHRPDIGPCWVWTGMLAATGYGQIRDGGGKTANSHRVSWELENGPIGDGLFVLHACDNRACVRPAHLSLGTARDNTLDCLSKGRFNGPARSMAGERNPRATFTSDQIREIRELRANGLVLREIAARFNTTIATVGRIAQRKAWGSVE